MAAPLLRAGAPVLAFDIGGTDVKATSVDAAGEVGPVLRAATPAPSPRLADELLDVLADTAALLRAGGATPAAVGVALPGVVDDEAGIAVDSENLRWANVPFRDLARERLGLPVAIVHDVRSATLAEARVGAALGLTDALVVTIGTGIAAGLIVDGTLLVRGGYAGELGHAVVRPGGEACACGNRGCLEATASAAAIARRYSRETGTPVAGARDVLARVEVDAVARAVWEDALDALALGLSHACALLAPQAVVVGGGLSGAGEALRAPLQERLDALFPVRRTPVVLARLGGRRGRRRRGPARPRGHRSTGVIATVTPNPAVDITIDIDPLDVGGTTPAHGSRRRAGGKGLNVARVLAQTGRAVVALGLVGADEAAWFADDLPGVDVHLTPCLAPTRHTYALVDIAHSRTSQVNERGTARSADEWMLLHDAVRTACRHASCLTVSGSLPPDAPADAVTHLVEAGRAAGIPVIADLTGDALRTAASAGADVVKPNRDELCATVGTDDPLTGARALQHLGAGLVVVSLGEDGLVAVPRSGDALHGGLPEPVQGNPTGAGDAVVAALSAWIDDGLARDDLSALVRRAVAWSAAAVRAPLAGTLDDTHDELARHVRVSAV